MSNKSSHIPLYIYKNEFVIAELLTAMDNVWALLSKHDFPLSIPIPDGSVNNIVDLFLHNILFIPNNVEEYHMHAVYYVIHNRLDLAQIYYKYAIGYGYSPSIHNMARSALSLKKREKYCEMCLSIESCGHCSETLKQIINIKTILRSVDENITNNSILSLIHSYKQLRGTEREIKYWRKIGITRRIPDCLLQMVKYYRNKKKMLKVEALLEYGYKWNYLILCDALVAHYITTKQTNKLLAIANKIGSIYDNVRIFLTLLSIWQWLYVNNIENKTYEAIWLYLAKVSYIYRLSSDVPGNFITGYYAKKGDLKNMLIYSKYHKCGDDSCVLNVLFNEYLTAHDYEKLTVEHDLIYNSCDNARNILAHCYYNTGNSRAALNIYKELATSLFKCVREKAYGILYKELVTNPSFLIQLVTLANNLEDINKKDNVHDKLHKYPHIVRHIPHGELIKCIHKDCRLQYTLELYNIFINIHHEFRDIFDNYLVYYI